MRSEFVQLQQRLRAFDAPGALTVVNVPSYDLDESILERHRAGLAAYEDRCLWTLGALKRPELRMVVVSRKPVPREIVDYHLGLIEGSAPADGRLEIISLDDDGTAPLARLLLARADLLERLRGLLRGDAFIMPFIVAHDDEALAVELGVPIYGIDTRFARYGTKSGGRALFREEGVPVAEGAEDLKSIEQVADAMMRLRRRVSGLAAVVLKHDDSVFGEGNVTLSLRDDPDPADLDVRLRSLPATWLQRLPLGAVVEEMLDGDEFQSPSAQVRIFPGGRVQVVSTHDQVLGGPLGQTFVGCRFPADPTYSHEIVSLGLRVGERLAREGAVGRFGVDFVATRTGGEPWDVRAVEINLREGGTSHPYGTLWLLTNGMLHAGEGVYRCDEGGAKHYFATDNLSHPNLRELGIRGLLERADAAGVAYDATRRSGVVFHRLRAVPVESEVAAVAIGAAREEADELYLRLVAALA